jgi:hypothetical protein
VPTDVVSALQISNTFRTANAAATAAMIDTDERLKMPRPLLNLGRGPTSGRRSSVVQSARERAAEPGGAQELGSAYEHRHALVAGDAADFADAPRSAVAVQRTIISPSRHR